MTKPLELVRGSTRHQIMAELERYPDSWFRWYQFPELTDVNRVTIAKAFSRLIGDGMVDRRMVLDFDESASASSRRPHGFHYREIRHRPEKDT